MKTQVVIADTSCLILLRKIGHLSLLGDLYGHLVITQVVANEFGEELPDWIQIENPSEHALQPHRHARLDPGETSSIGLAMEKHPGLLIVDDLAARRYAETLGLTITGTAGVLLQAKQAELISTVRPFIDLIRKTDFRLSERVVDSVLRQAGEL